MATTDASGTQTGTYTYDPFGNPVNSSPDNTAPGSTYGWVGQHEKDTETAFTLAPTQMGARVYLAKLGRFLQVDPVEGGVENSYVYPPDPVNKLDLDGRFAFLAIVPFLPVIAATLYRAAPHIARYVAPVVRSGNNFIRVGRPYAGAAFRVSFGPTYKHYQSLPRWRKVISPVSVHIEKRYGGMSFNWLTKVNSKGKRVARSWQWWSKR